jgi:hypothetical protein
MARPIIRIKRSTIPNRKPTVNDLQLAELALNVNDAELYAKRERVGFATDVVRLGAGATVTNVLYVTKDGNDNNTGRKLGDAKATIKSAVEAASPGTVIKVSAGNYIENNPITLPEQMSIVGDNLREVSIQCQNPGDLFYVSNGNYVTELSFTGPPNPGGAIFAFNPNIVRYFDQSPYIQNCTNFVPESIGLKVDGSKAIGPLKSMVLDSYTQYNQGGIGASMTNEGYAQLVSLFTICNDISVYCGSGGGCDLTNSNSSFGNYALIADGVSANKYTGSIIQNYSAGAFEFALDISSPTYNITNAKYDYRTGILTCYTNLPHKFEIGVGVTISGLGFTCSSGNGNTVIQYPSGNFGYIFEPFSVSPGRYYDAYNLIQLNRDEIINGSYSAIQTAYPSFVIPDAEKCKRDIGYILDAVSTDVRDFTNKNTINAIKKYFKIDGTLLENGVQGEIPQTIVGFNSTRELMKLAITNNLTNKDLTIAPDPLTGSNTNSTSCSDVKTFIDNLVGIVTTRLNAGNINGVNLLPQVSMASTVFSVYVGPAPFDHYYVSGGTVKLNIVRPFDGQIIYFDELYYEIKSIEIKNAGSGYTENPVVTIESPEVSWGIGAQCVAQSKNGKVDSVDIVSTGRGYRTIPKITITGPQTGINTAILTATLTPIYYSVSKSTPVVSGITTITLNDNVPYDVGIGTQVPFFKQSRLLASGQSLEYIGTGVEIAYALPRNGGVQIPEQETDSRNGGLVVYTSTDQSGNFKIGDGVIINQATGSITGDFYSKSLFATMTPFILALGGDL